MYSAIEYRQREDLCVHLVLVYDPVGASDWFDPFPVCGIQKTNSLIECC